MARNNFPVYFIFIAFFLFISSNVFADDTPPMEAGYFIDNTGENLNIKQRFVWEKEEYALRYEIEIQRFDFVYSNYLIESTEKTYIEVSLPPGKYRYSVTPFDLLGMRADASEWKGFEVFPAHMPVIQKFIPEIFYLDINQERILNITGINFQPETKIYLSNSDNTLLPVKLNIISGNRAELVFDDKLLIPGEYDIHIINPGEFKTMANGFNIGYRKPLDVFFRVGYNPGIPIYGEMQDIFGTNLFLAGLSLSLESVSSKRSTFNGGLEFGASLLYINSKLSLKMDNDSSLEDGMLFTDININIVLQKRFNNWKNYFTFRFGFGITALSGFGNYSDGDIGVHLNANLSSMFRISNILFLDIGADFSHYFADEITGLIKPRLGLVWKF